MNAFFGFQVERWMFMIIVLLPTAKATCTETISPEDVNIDTSFFEAIVHIRSNSSENLCPVRVGNMTFKPTFRQSSIEYNIPNLQPNGTYTVNVANISKSFTTKAISHRYIYKSSIDTLTFDITPERVPNETEKITYNVYYKHVQYRGCKNYLSILYSSEQNHIRISNPKFTIDKLKPFSNYDVLIKPKYHLKNNIIEGQSIIFKNISTNAYQKISNKELPKMTITFEEKNQKMYMIIDITLECSKRLGLQYLDLKVNDDVIDTNLLFEVHRVPRKREVQENTPYTVSLQMFRSNRTYERQVAFENGTTPQLRPLPPKIQGYVFNYRGELRISWENVEKTAIKNYTITISWDNQIQTISTRDKFVLLTMFTEVTKRTEIKVVVSANNDAGSNSTEVNLVKKSKPFFDSPPEIIEASNEILLKIPTVTDPEHIIHMYLVNGDEQCFLEKFGASVTNKPIVDYQKCNTEWQPFVENVLDRKTDYYIPIAIKESTVVYLILLNDGELPTSVNIVRLTMSKKNKISSAWFGLLSLLLIPFFLIIYCIYKKAKEKDVDVQRFNRSSEIIVGKHGSLHEYESVTLKHNLPLQETQSVDVQRNKPSYIEGPLPDEFYDKIIEPNVVDNSATNSTYSEETQANEKLYEVPYQHLANGIPIIEGNKKVNMELKELFANKSVKETTDEKKVPNEYIEVIG